MRLTRAVARIASVLALAGCGAAMAHHSFSAIYDQSQDVALDGVVREFRFVHPHPVLVIDVGDGRGKTAWAAEMDNRYELEEIGITALTFRPGDKVRVNGSPGRRLPNVMYLWKLLRPEDGLRYEQIGVTPYLHPGPTGTGATRPGG